MLKEILVLVMLVLSIPLGFWVAWLCRDELVSGRRWFKLVMILSVVGSLVFLVYGEISAALTLFCLAIISYISHKKSFDKKWTKKRI